jgi:hypothetical protein
MSGRRPDVETEPAGVDTDINGDGEANLLDLEFVARGDNTNTILIDINTNVNGDDEADLLDLKWIAREENAHPPEYYLD